MSINFSKGQRVTIGAIILALLFNPMSVEILDDYFKLAYTVISVVCTAWVVGYLLKKVLTPEKVNIPKKLPKLPVAKGGLKSSTQFIET